MKNPMNEKNINTNLIDAIDENKINGGAGIKILLSAECGCVPPVRTKVGCEPPMPKTVSDCPLPKTIAKICNAKTIVCLKF